MKTVPLDDSFNDEKKPGLFPLPGKLFEGCADPSHFPAHYIAIPAGYGYRHVCPTCGAVQEIHSQQVTC